MNVLIFKTNLATKIDFNKICNILFNLPDVYDCTIDLEDCDKVLRVITSTQTAGCVKQKINNIGFACDELED